MMYPIEYDLMRHHEERVEELSRQYQSGKQVDQWIVAQAKALGSRVGGWFGGSSDKMQGGGRRLEPQPVRVESR